MTSDEELAKTLAQACGHGCWGDCLIGKAAPWHAHIQSPDCLPSCHPYDGTAERFQGIISRLETERDALTAEIIARKQAITFLAAVELTQMTEGWGD